MTKNIRIVRKKSNYIVMSSQKKKMLTDDPERWNLGRSRLTD